MSHPVLTVILLALLLAVALSLRRARRSADAAAVAARRLREDRQRLLDFMHFMTQALGAGLSRQELQQRIVHAAIICTGALSGCFFVRTSRNTMRSVAVEGLFPPHRPLTDEVKAALTTRAKFLEHVLKAEEFPVEEGIVGRVARNRRGELLADAEADARMVKHDDPALRVRSVIVVPLVFRRQFFGVLAVTNPAGGRRFTPAEFHLMESLAEQAALALHNAEFLHLQMERRQLDLDLSLASSIQQMLLPREELRFDGVELNARYKSAQKVGGDFYDVFALSPERLGVVVGDVSGKGIPASLLMAICRTHLRQIAPRHTSPGAALVELNRTMGGDCHGQLYITLLYAIIDVRRNELTYARAGHECPLLVRRDPAAGRVRAEFGAGEGMAVGMVPDAMFAETMADHTERFEPGSVCVLYTDGLTEAPNEDGKEFSGARLADMVVAAFALPPRAVNDAVLAAAERFTGGTPQRDDFTLVTVRRV
ncbi:GAF domain-containing SpoIIE family protein phosphatase [Opitutus sp. ER46]|uniref:PP2C family protein-serine/threonine phosphatase n=1 Tax=Opitutus sp. ER46 TaxID=2161864 RepID=UPI000D30C3C1|nr:GAF domain-containing SpoIIE family protein phosphatase [Opitutus sp. ER46]PTX91240.1 protein serine phosphatase [Opitutus sp. ER46]